MNPDEQGEVCDAFVPPHLRDESVLAEAIGDPIGEETTVSGRKVAYAQGYLDGLREGGWKCHDCENWYEANVEECPNKKIDEAFARLRHENWKAENG